MQRFNWVGLISAALLGSLTVAASAQCVLDADGNGMMNGADLLPLLAAVGTPDADYDFNANGVVDIEDVMQGARELGQTCPISLDTATTGIIAGPVLELVATHPDPIFGPTDTIPAGSTTYRLYVQSTTPAATCQGIFGRDAHEFSVATDNGLFSSTFVNMDIASNVNPLFFPFDPTLGWTSWITTGWSPEMLADVVLGGPETGTVGSIELSGSADFSWDSAAGAGVFEVWPASATGFATMDSTLHLVGQFTTLGSPSFAATFNAVLRLGETYETAYGLEVNDSDAVFAGCMDPTAMNFDPQATIPLDVCLILGDLDGDGVVATPDLMALLAIFGCTTCPEGDFDGDGVVGIGDILIFLGLFGE